MKQSSIVMILAATTLLLTGPANAQEDRGSGNYVLPLCKVWLRMSTKDLATIKNELTVANSAPGGIPMYFMQAGMCAGEVVGISEMLTGVCIPTEVSNEQLVRVVVAGIEKRPQDMHKSFSVLAAVALTLAWPCTKR
jgi:hypothetical protein